MERHHVDKGIEVAMFLTGLLGEPDQKVKPKSEDDTPIEGEYAWTWWAEGDDLEDGTAGPACLMIVSDEAVSVEVNFNAVGIHQHSYLAIPLWCLFHRVLCITVLGEDRGIVGMQTTFPDESGPADTSSRPKPH